MKRRNRRGAGPTRARALCLAACALAAHFAVGGPRPALGSAPELPPQVQAPTISFLETFDGKPTNPTPWNRRDWDVFQTSRNTPTWAAPSPVNAHHAFSGCGDVAAGGSHTIDTWPETVFLCNDHVMTSINGNAGYAAIYLSPPVMADFGAGASTIGFDVSTFVSSSRDWLDVLITPFADAMSYPFRSDLDVDGSGLPRNAIHIEQGFGSDMWEIEVIRNGVVSSLGTLQVPFSQIGGQSKVTRTPVRIVVRPTSLTLSYPTVSGASRTVSYAALGWSQGIVQFGHHSYDPLKDCGNCAANTWHWDNVRINPARPFYQWQATPERTGAAIHDSNPRTLSFGQPAPSNAVLVFSGTCGVQVRNSSASAWRAATIIGPNSHPEHTQSYRVTVTPGTTSIQFRFVNNDWYGPGTGCQLSNPVVKALTPTTSSPLFTWDRDSGQFAIRTMSAWTFTMRYSGTLPTVYDDVVVGDFDSDGISDDYFIWDRNTGYWVVRTSGLRSLDVRSSGTWWNAHDQVMVGDFDSNGYVNDLMVWDNNSGRWSIYTMNQFQPTKRRDGSYPLAYDSVVVGDFDSDGRRDDVFIWDRTAGFWVVHSFAAGSAASFRSSGRSSFPGERAYNIDCDLDGASDDLLLWDDNTGRAQALSFTAAKPVHRRYINFSSTLDIAASGDLSGDGRRNELFVFDRDARAWQVFQLSGSCAPVLARAGTFPVAYDVAWG